MLSGSTETIPSPLVNPMINMQGKNWVGSTEELPTTAPTVTEQTKFYDGYILITLGLTGQEWR
jgi:hypothetical protein